MSTTDAMPPPATERPPSSGPTAAWLVGLAIALGLLAAFLLYEVGSVSLVRTELVSGPALFVGLVFLSIYGARRRLNALALIGARAWLQAHVLVGLFTVALFAVHTRLRLPNGTLEVTLAALYAIVVLSGVVGSLASRRLARRLDGGVDADGTEDSLLARLRDGADAVVERTVRETGSTELAAFYRDRLAPFFSGHGNTVAHLLGSRRPRHRLLATLLTMRRSVGEQEREAADQLSDLVRAKDELDHRVAVRQALGAWLLLHLPLTFLLLVLAAIHAVAARSFLLGSAP